MILRFDILEILPRTMQNIFQTMCIPMFIGLLTHLCFPLSPLLQNSSVAPFSFSSQAFGSNINYISLEDWWYQWLGHHCVLLENAYYGSKLVAKSILHLAGCSFILGMHCIIYYNFGVKKTSLLDAHVVHHFLIF